MDKDWPNNLTEDTDKHWKENITHEMILNSLEDIYKGQDKL